MSRHFSDSEFACPCCGKDIIRSELKAVLELVRLQFGGSPVFINSGYRCPSHNAAVGGSEKSQHLKGTAADIAVNGVLPEVVYSYLDSVFPNTYGLGRYETFTHIDVRKQKARW